MQFSFLFRFESWQLMIILLVLMIASNFMGRIAGKNFHRESQVDSTILGSLFGLLGLLLAFTFSLAINYYDMRRETIIEEANDIGTAILRADLYTASDRKAFRTDFKDYVDARISYFSSGADVKKIKTAQERSVKIQNKLWAHVSQLNRDSGYIVPSMQMIPALNSMIDITTKRQYGNLVHLPDTVIYLLYLLSCACTFYIGYMFANNGKLDWLIVTGFCLFTSMIVYVIFDLDRPRRGFITLDQINNSIVELKSMFTE